MNLAITNYFSSVPLLSNALPFYYMLEFLEQACMYVTGFVFQQANNSTSDLILATVSQLYRQK